MIAVVILATLAIYWFLLRDETVAGRVHLPELASMIGSGRHAVGVSATGQIVPLLAVPTAPPPPQLPLDSVPKSGKLGGTVLVQARVLGAAPKELRPYIKRSYYGESGVDVILTNGIELRFGDASQARRKWKAATAVLADPSITALGYVDLHAPARPSIWGSEHSLPPLPN